MKSMYLLAASILSLLSACVSQPSKHASVNVQVLAQNRVAHCKKLKTAKITVQTVVGIWHLYPADVKADLMDRAQKRAVAVGANTASPLTEPNNGKQTFGLYKCLGLKVNNDESNAGKAKKNNAEVQTIPYHPHPPS